jgi:hypothetical protein
MKCCWCHRLPGDCKNGGEQAGTGSKCRQRAKLERLSGSLHRRTIFTSPLSLEESLSLSIPCPAGPSGKTLWASFPCLYNLTNQLIRAGGL